MPTSSDTCPKCQGKMSDGFILDIGYGERMAAHWYPGPVFKSNWQGLINLRRAKKRQITANRCERCGFLELYVP